MNDLADAGALKVNIGQAQPISSSLPIPPTSGCLNSAVGENRQSDFELAAEFAEGVAEHYKEEL